MTIYLEVVIWPGNFIPFSHNAVGSIFIQDCSTFQLFPTDDQDLENIVSKGGIDD